MISKFDGEYSFLSNFHPWGFTYRGIYMPTAEHAFQASKAKYPHDMIWVAESDTPGIAKRRGRKVELKPNWDSDRIGEMLLIVTAKFNSAEDRMNQLLATGENKLVEGNWWHDNFWGNCLCHSCEVAGQNYLGKILMYIRKNA